MKKLLVSLLFATMASPLLAQTDVDQAPVATEQTAPEAPIRFGYLSYDALLKSSPDYAAAQQSLAELRDKYDAEMKRVEDEFNEKYETFLDGQSSYAPSILQKRQAELQEMMEKNIAFKQESRRLLEQAEADALQPVREKLAAAILKVGKEKKLAFIANTDGNAMPFIDTTMGVDVSNDVAAAMQ